MNFFNRHAMLGNNKRLGSIVGNETEIKLSSPKSHTLAGNKGNFTIVEKLKHYNENPSYDDANHPLMKYNSVNKMMHDGSLSPLNVFVERKKNTIVQNPNFTPVTNDDCIEVEYFEEEEAIEIK